MHEWFGRIHPSHLNRIFGHASFRPYLPAVSRGINGLSASYINSTRSCWRIICNDASSLRTRSPTRSHKLTITSIHVRVFVHAHRYLRDATQRMQRSGGNSSWTARVEIVKPPRRADNDFDPINSSWRHLPRHCHLNGKRTYATVCACTIHLVSGRTFDCAEKRWNDC